MVYKIKNLKTNNLSTLKSSVDNNARFVIFNYRISPVAFSILRVSPILYIENDIDFQKYKKKYNLLNLIFGPWLFFTGPFLAYSTYKLNSSGGIDVTEDVINNITEDQLKNNVVEIKKIHQIFEKVDTSTKKDIKKIIGKTDLNLVPLKKVYLGLYTNTDEHEDPYYILGIEAENPEALDEDSFTHIKNNIYKVFYKHVRFEFLLLNEEDEISNKLISQGDLIYEI